MRRSRIAGSLLMVLLLFVPSTALGGEYKPDVARIRGGLVRSARGALPRPAAIPKPTDGGRAAAQDPAPARIYPGKRDSVWNGMAIGAGIGAGGGYIWARSQCPNDP